MKGLSVSRIRTRVAEVRKDGGIKGLLFAFVAEMGYRRTIIRECRLQGRIEPAEARIALQVGLLETQELEEYNRFRGPSDPGSAARRMANGDRCFVGRHQGRIVGACWLSTGSAWSAYLAAPVPLTADEAYSYDLFTDSAWRGNGVPAAIMSRMHHYCQQHGFSRVIAFTIPENRPAMTRSIGYRSIGIIGYFGIGRFRHFFCRMKPGMRAPGRTAHATPDWNGAVSGLAKNGHYLDDFLARMKRQAYLDLIDRWGGLPPSGRVLKTDLFEEAMGPDAFLLDLASSSTTLIGMDLSTEAAARARRRDPARKATYLAADSRALPFGDQTIEMVISPSTLDHFPESADLDRSLGEMRRVIAPGGRLIITLDNRQNVFDPLLRLANKLGRVPYFLGQSYTIRELCEKLRSAGFDVTDTTAIVHHPRLVGVASMGIANRIGLALVRRSIERSLLEMQKLRGSRLQYFSGCFVAALAVPTLAPALESFGEVPRKVEVA